MVTYKESGVDINKGDELVESIKQKVKSTYGTRVYEGVGGFAALYEITDDKLLSVGTDGVGTKLKIAQHLGIHNTIGIDLVAMCVNDILCTGATPLLFLDYLACGKLDLNISQSLIDGIVDGCKQSQCALIGGETAEMPGFYKDDEYDLAGFAVGEVFKKDLIDGKKIKEGDTIIGLPSSGLHSNGYSLVRKIISKNDHLNMALTPTKIYHQILSTLLKEHRENILGLAHITGSGFLNISRMNSNFDYVIENLPDFDEIPPIFSILKNLGNLDLKEMYQTFNMGIGLTIVTDNPKCLTTSLDRMGEKYWILGETVNGMEKIIFKNENLIL
ncbi:MAG: phosphoribosylformylglycinamidine cyclo-ligase [Bdellovibrionales bacterium RIFOXYA1_FULL_36_14]|nr:MAG: phosphoribosylformylglycinamidine cyclo-ligase [Bdellovibrionales bacterium RIFOXYA1_FULL_36_14]